MCLSIVAQERPVVHDPVMIQENGVYYMFCTGMGIDVWSSTDMEKWTKEDPIFKKAPSWTKKAVIGFEGHFWAPDIAYYNNEYYLYYSVSAFGKNTSCMGLVTNKTLDPDDPEFKWIDQGKVIQSYPGKTDWNAIDPNLIVGIDGTPYLSFGSFWGGLKIAKLTPDAKRVNDNLNELQTIASRFGQGVDRKHVDEDALAAGVNAIEAPFIFKKGDYYYLFASIDFCCRGAESTYKIIVARSESILGPYLDKEDVDMAKGGGTLVLKGNKDWFGVGHNSAYTFENNDFLVFHGYDATDNGEPKLIIKQIKWDTEGWPIVSL